MTWQKGECFFGENGEFSVFHEVSSSILWQYISWNLLDALSKKKLWKYGSCHLRFLVENWQQLKIGTLGGNIWVVVDDKSPCSRLFRKLPIAKRYEVSAECIPSYDCTTEMKAMNCLDMRTYPRLRLNSWLPVNRHDMPLEITLSFRLVDAKGAPERARLAALYLLVAPQRMSVRIGGIAIVTTVRQVTIKVRFVSSLDSLFGRWVKVVHRDITLHMR